MVDVRVKDLGVPVTCYLLPKVPPILSLGLLCLEHGFSYHWPNAMPPFLKQKQKRTECAVVKNCPFVTPAYEGVIKSELAVIEELRGVTPHL